MLDTLHTYRPVSLNFSVRGGTGNKQRAMTRKITTPIQDITADMFIELVGRVVIHVNAIQP